MPTAPGNLVHPVNFVRNRPEQSRNFYHIPVESNVAEKVERVGVGLLRVLRKLIEGDAALLQGFDDGARSSALLQC